MDQPERKRQYNQERRRRFTPEEKTAALAHQKLYLQHRRLTDAEYLAKVRATNRAQYTKHRVKRIAAMQDKHWQTRLHCLQAYGGADPFCGCCGESTLECLTLDHIEDRRSDGGVRVGGDRIGQVLYSWLIRMNFPPGFRVRCFNCNCARGNRGYCPHELALDEAVERMVI